MPASNLIEYRTTKRGKWRAYLVEKQALMSWRGDNFKSTVIRGPEDKIVERDTDAELERYLHSQVWYWVSYRGTSLTEANVLARAERERKP